MMSSSTRTKRSVINTIVREAVRANIAAALKAATARLRQKQGNK